MKFKHDDDLTFEEFQKSLFVKVELTALCGFATGGQIKHLVYLKAAESDDEFVKVAPVHGVEFLVNVSCDSRLAIAKDVVGELIARGF